ncbi:unnamed protein product [Camellia sinensis]
MSSFVSSSLHLPSLSHNVTLTMKSLNCKILFRLRTMKSKLFSRLIIVNENNIKICRLKVEALHQSKGQVA